MNLALAPGLPWALEGMGRPMGGFAWMCKPGLEQVHGFLDRGPGHLPQCPSGGRPAPFFSDYSLLPGFPSSLEGKGVCGGGGRVEPQAEQSGGRKAPARGLRCLVTGWAPREQVKKKNRIRENEAGFIGEGIGAVGI